MILERIHSSADVKKLSEDELVPLCEEIRQELVKTVSQTGGHLAPNLGVVELSVALHRVYDTASDRLVFDVGHQSYVHKMLTGRREQMASLRRYHGLAGYPKPTEADDDAFIAGHASNSIAVALGMARARTLSHDNYQVAAVIGDGALTGGLAYEGLCNAAASGEPMVIILNDNAMSINKNVGGVNSLLQRLRIRPGYLRFKRWYRDTFKNVSTVYQFNHAIKESLKSWLLPDNIFSEMGLSYLGPVDGHDVRTLETVLRWARDTGETVLVHVLTTKGKGYAYAEQRPDIFHGIGQFDPKTGEVFSQETGFSDAFGKALCDYAAKDEKLVAITAAMTLGTGLKDYAKAYPDRFFDVGIAEGAATAIAGGMARQGLLPVFAVYSSFLQRGYDMLLHDISLMGLHVVFAVDRSGLVGADGETHNGVFDVNYLSSVPGMTIYCPASFRELNDMLGEALYHETGPVAVRYPRGGEGEYLASDCGAEQVVCEGTDLTVVCYGTLINEVLPAVRSLEERGISAEILKLGKLKPNPFTLTLQSLRKTGRLLVVEEVCAAGCVGEQLLAQAEQSRLALKGARLLNLGSGIVAHGAIGELWHEYHLDREGITMAACELVLGGREA